MAKATSTSPDEVRTSVTSIYSELLNKRRLEQEARSEQKRQERQAREEAKAAKETKPDGTKMKKSEKRQAELDAWKEIIIGLTGDDLEYSETGKKRKKKYRKWIGEEDGTPILTPKVKKHKKRNYRKEFDPELNMLKTIVADQNRFTVDLQRRFQNAAGPATKDAMPLNKTLVELAAAVNASRANSLGLIREIGNLKKTIADLYMKQAKMDADAGSAGFNATDLGLMGSNIAASMFGDNSPMGGGTATNPYASMPSGGAETPSYSSGPIPTTTLTPSSGANAPIDAPGGMPPATSFDPTTWEGPSLGEGASVNYENIPKDIVVEWHKSQGVARFKAVSRETGQELTGCPVPTSDPSKLTFNEKDKTVKGEFDETYQLEIIE